ncbi:hypothetical protein V1478_017169, partial [Vespula squamosa]
ERKEVKSIRLLSSTVCSSAKRNHVGSQDGAGPDARDLAKAYLSRVSSSAAGGTSRRLTKRKEGKREEKSAEAGEDELSYETRKNLGSVDETSEEKRKKERKKGFLVPIDGRRSHQLFLLTWACPGCILRVRHVVGSGVGVGDGDACSGRCGFRRVTTLGYGVSRWPSVEGAPRGLIGAPRIDPIT